MLNYNVSASGQKLYVNFGQDVSSGTSFTMTLEPQSGEKIEVIPTLGTVDVIAGDETFLANQYVESTTQAEQLKFEGIWRIKGTATLATDEVVAANYVRFRVSP